MTTDPIADMLTRIRNVQMVNKSEVILPYSKLKFNILKLLETKGWIADVEKVEPAERKGKSNYSKKSREYIYQRFTTLKVKLKYDKGKPKINSLRRISKPGRRVYIDKNEIPIILNGKGIAVISTSKGLMTDDDARKYKVGGEYICEIY